MRYYVKDRFPPDKEGPLYWLKRGHGYAKKTKDAYPFDHEAAQRILADCGVHRITLEEAGTYVYRCECCPGEPPPIGSAIWSITRRGDVATTWSCDEHMVTVIRRLREDRPPGQEFVVRMTEAAVREVDEFTVRRQVEPLEKQPLGQAEADHMLALLRAHYRQPVMPLKQFCKGLERWGRAMLKGGPKGAPYEELGKDVLGVVGSARKSNLLYRIFFLGEEPRKRPCPVHKGHWSGCDFSGTCKCQSGANVTGWLPDEPEGGDEG